MLGRTLEALESCDAGDWSTGHVIPASYNDRAVEDAINDLRAALAAPATAPLDDEHPYTYASTQATTCASCGEYAHTPLRIDAMGGYVCLTCIDQKLGSLLGEFGYPAPATAPEQPAWHDAPTVPGLWAWKSRLTGEMYFSEVAVQFVNQAHSGRWYGPIPQEPAP